jgi:hypothetical protein
MMMTPEAANTAHTMANRDLRAGDLAAWRTWIVNEQPPTTASAVDPFAPVDIIAR